MTNIRRAVPWVLLLAACSSEEPIGPEGTGGAGAAATTTTTSSGSGATTTSGSTSSTTSGTGGFAPCPDGVTCVTSFPFTDMRDTSTEGSAVIPSYDCSPDTDEGGSEILYRVTVPADGFLSVAVYDGDGVDIDVHILTELDPAAPAGTSCVDRGDLQASADVMQGDVWVVADTWVSGSGAQPGPFKLDIGFIAASVGSCAMQTGEMPRVGDGGVHLTMPATGPVVQEAHLVTQSEPAPFPSSSTEELAEHYALSQTQTGLVMHRAELWAPLEGGRFYGAGIGDPADLPVLDEGWYVNMYWTPAARPPKGTRMILRSPNDPTRAVVVAAGYETGPSDLSRIGGTTEETHYYLGSQHDAELELGIAEDQSLPLGPRRCSQ
ncbi:MAG: hypothetical protein JNL21_07990 [Myxococcales bacterium]|nr:hypothetical protein [Myxococcales bacterium]